MSLIIWAISATSRSIARHNYDPIGVTNDQIVGLGGTSSMY